TVASNLATTQNGLCYSYSKSAGDIPLTLQCPSGQLNPWNAASGTTAAGSITSTSTTGSTSSSPAASSVLTAAWLEHLFESLVPSANLLKITANKIGLSTLNDPVSIAAPPAQDRADLDNLRHPSELPEAYIKMMHMDLQTVRKAEALARSATDYFNNVRGYSSPAALKYFARHNKLRRPPGQ
ncbi:hypothetical protein HDU91_003897, partial [Kappamyces sp. JEL0680]